MEKNAHYKVITAIGSDRVGIADDLAAIVARNNCNIEESKMAVLGGEFAVIMLLSGSPDQLRLVSEELSTAKESLGLQVFAKDTRAHAFPRGGVPYILHSISQDTPGIVHAITSILRRHDINIEDLETETTFAPWSGAPLFHMRARIMVHPNVSPHSLREELRDLEQRQDLNIELKPFYPAPSE